MPIELVCATGNLGKLREFQSAAGDAVSIEGFGPLDCPETGSTFEENAASKAVCYARAYSAARGRDDGLVFADDSGIEVDALGAAPGVFSARYAGENADDEANNKLLLERLGDTPRERRTARFVCVIALARGVEIVKTFRGSAEGLIRFEPAGGGGFGYDPLFDYPPLGRGFAELSAEEKWEHSHRGMAFRAMLAWLREGA